MAKRTLKDVDVRGKRVLVRVDFNVPIEQGVEAIASYDQRLRATLPTVQYLLEQDSKVILCSHLGRPKGKVVEGLRMAPVVDRLSLLLSRPVKSMKDCTGPEVEASIAGMSGGDIVMLENLRFHPGEEKNDPEFASALASLADLFVMDAFAVAHRGHASTVGVPRYLPSVAGLLVQREMELMGKALDAPARPLAALLGGAKVSDKIMVLENLLDRIDRLFIGGGMSVTFSAHWAAGRARHRWRKTTWTSPPGFSGGPQTKELTSISLKMWSSPTSSARTPDVAAPCRWTGSRTGRMSWTSGLRPLRIFVTGLGACKTVIWNGPMGVFEFPAFTEGTRRVAEASRPWMRPPWWAAAPPPRP